ncbi:hypothetical protein CGC58_06725 [Capnocytophaga stomatis]|uniref:Uncharacterized protein n=1 Tax=Capnocytophaga stomatis TaxID=1848904 RepID=A0A250FZL7_9FLAO|nr:hypothetical protein CGC58_06725 [Capnocytophaga stomatis]
MGNNPFFYYIFAQSSLIFILLCKTKMLKILGTFNFPLKKFRQVFSIIYSLPILRSLTLCYHFSQEDTQKYLLFSFL